MTGADRVQATGVCRTCFWNQGKAAELGTTLSCIAEISLPTRFLESRQSSTSSVGALKQIVCRTRFWNQGKATARSLGKFEGAQFAAPVFGIKAKLWCVWTV